MEGSGSVLVTNGSGCGSERPKNIRILRIRIRMRIRILNTAVNQDFYSDSDPQICMTELWIRISTSSCKQEEFFSHLLFHGYLNHAYPRRVCFPFFKPCTCIVCSLKSDRVLNKKPYPDEEHCFLFSCLQKLFRSTYFLCQCIFGADTNVADPDLYPEDS
jgi:hypothetical protein